MALKLGKIKAERTYQMVARSIEEEVLSGRAAPGESLPSEEKLAVQLGVNRSTVREALRVLEQHGLVRRETGAQEAAGGQHPASSEVSKPLSAAMILHQVTFEELWAGDACTRTPHRGDCGLHDNAAPGLGPRRKPAEHT